VKPVAALSLVSTLLILNLIQVPVPVFHSPALAAETGSESTGNPHADDPVVTLGLFGRYTALDNSLPVDDALGIGARLGWFFARDWALEADLSFNQDQNDDVDISLTPFHLRLLRQWHATDDLRFHVAGGYVHSEYGGDLDASDDGVSMMAGFEHDLSRRLSFRLDGVADANLDGVDYANFDGAAGDDDGNDWNVGLEFGLGLGFGTYGAGRDGDEDMDGVPDSKDKCPGTPRGTPVDADGCPKLFEEGKTDVILNGVNFEVDKATLLSESRAILDGVADILLAHPEIRVEVQGHTDNTGTPAHNMDLSNARANSVRDYLMSRGVPPGQLTANGYGQDRPIDTNDTDAGRSRNRRVELKRMD